jgi:CSLREA domain-containing protein
MLLRISAFSFTLILLTALLLAGTNRLTSYAAPAAPTENLIVVTTMSDNLDAFDQKCSLREALYNVNNKELFSPVVNECPAASLNEPNVILLQSGETYALTIAGGGNDEGDLDILADVHMRVDGETAATLQMSVNGQGVLQVHPNVTATLANLTVRGGKVAGGIFNEGNLTLNNVTIMSNSATAGGGGV